MHTPTGVALLVSMLPLVALTFAVLVLVAGVRFKAVYAGRLKPRDFRYGESEAVPGDLRTPNRILMNLLEMPLLFYVLRGEQYRARRHVGALRGGPGVNVS